MIKAKTFLWLSLIMWLKVKRVMYTVMSPKPNRNLSIPSHDYTIRFPHLGWGLLSRFPPFRYFPNFSALSNHTLDIEYHVYIWQVSPQLSCGDTCQIWKWFKETNRYFWKIEHFAYGEINERSFSNPYPSNRISWTTTCCHVIVIFVVEEASVPKVDIYVCNIATKEPLL